MPQVGRLLAELRQAKGWTQERAAQELTHRGFRFTRGYLGGVEAGKLPPSRNLLAGAEKIYELEKGALLQYAALEQAERWCADTSLSVIEYIDMLRRALQGAAAAGPGPEASTAHAARVRAGDPGDIDDELEGRRGSLMSPFLALIPA